MLNMGSYEIHENDDINVVKINWGINILKDF